MRDRYNQAEAHKMKEIERKRRMAEARAKRAALRAAQMGKPPPTPSNPLTEAQRKKYEEFLEKRPWGPHSGRRGREREGSDLFQPRHGDEE